MLWIALGTFVFRFVQPRLRDWEPFQRRVQPWLDRNAAYVRVQRSFVGRRVCVVRQALA
jgi:hypothetical protein